MNIKKILLVFGTRPEAIKMAPLYHALKAVPGDFETKICVTAQHRQMLDQVLQVFGITPDIDLNVMKKGQDLFDVTGSVLMGMREVLRAQKPDVLLIHGDTTTTMAAALAGFYEGVPIGHVEAGLRTHNLQAPFPEEFNRQVASKLAKWHFAPTDVSRQNLVDENIPDSSITITGNTVIDALFWVLERIEADPIRKAALDVFLSEKLNFNWRKDQFILITGHRRENFGGGFLEICNALGDLAERHPTTHFIYPVHLNPNVQNPVKAVLSNFQNIKLIEPLDYEPFVYLLKHSHLVLTDSGGIQEEAPSLGKPVLVMRDLTERPEGVLAGTVRLVGANRQKIITNVSELLDDESSYKKMCRAHNPYGDGSACAQIISTLRNI